MKRILLGLTALSCVALAGEGTNLYLSAGIDISGKFDETKPEGTKINGDKSDESGFEITTEVTREVMENFELGLGISYQDHDKPKSTSDNVDTFYNTGYKSVPLYVVGKYNIPLESNIKPYIKADLGYSFNFDEKDLIIKDGTQEDRVSTSVDDGMYYGIGAGVEYNNFFVELMYKANQAKMKYTSPTGSFKGDYDYSRTTLAFGYKFNF